MKLDEILKNELNEDIDKIQVPASLYDFAKNIKAESVKSEVQKVQARKPLKRKYQLTAAAILGLGVLTGAAFLNPTVAEVASKIPYLGQVFKTKPVDQEIFAALEKEGYKKITLSMTSAEKVQFEVQIMGTKEEADRERESITKIISNILSSRGYDQYEIKVSSYIPEITPLTEEEKQLTELGLKLEDTLRKSGYDIIVVNPFNTEIEVEIPLTEQRGEEIKNAALTLAKENGSEKDVFVTSIDVEKNKRENLWLDHLRSIHEGLALKKEYKVTGYGYSYKSEKMKIIIKTSLKPTDVEAKEIVEKIREEINSFLTSEEVKTKLGDQPYEIMIRDSNGKQLSF